MNSFQTPNDGMVADALTSRSANRFIGSQVMNFANYFGLPLASVEDSTALRRATAEIRSIKLIDAFGSRIHVLTMEGEWLASHETGFVGLHALPEDRLRFWGEAHIDETLPKMPGCSARAHGFWPCTCLSQKQRRLGIDALQYYKNHINPNSPEHSQETKDLEDIIRYLLGEWIQTSNQST